MSKKSDFGYIINWKFHLQNRWVCALTPYLINAIVKEFDPIIITNQFEYNINKKKIKYIISSEPGWSGKFIKLDKKQKHISGVFVSDPHKKIGWFPKYVDDNNINFAFSYYYNPFFYNMPDFPKEKLIHLPWAIPDELISDNKIEIKNSEKKEIIIFGGRASDAYDVRNWCREQPGVKSFDNSGVENKKMTDQEYFKWLSNFDAVIAAGSSDPKYDMVTPKYFEIAASGSLLFGQYCKDLELLGFNESNSVIFNKENFNEKVNNYIENPNLYLEIRKKGWELIKERHKVSDRINVMKRCYLNH